MNSDVEVSSDGNFLYFVDGRFDQHGGPYEAEESTGWFRLSSRRNESPGRAT